MSYQTNPIINRLTINKGWKNASFPETLSFYPRNNVFLFKIFLFLKAYFAIRKIKLLSCEIRISEEHLPILYLVINNNTRRKKKRARYQKTYKRKYSSTKYSTLRNPFNLPALHLLYMSLSSAKNNNKYTKNSKLKAILNSRLLPLTKKQASQLWLIKPRFKSWLNFLNYIRITRNNLYKRQTLKKFNTITINNKSYRVKQLLQHSSS